MNPFEDFFILEKQRARQNTILMSILAVSLLASGMLFSSFLVEVRDHIDEKIEAGSPVESNIDKLKLQLQKQDILMKAMDEELKMKDARINRLQKNTKSPQVDNSEEVNQLNRKISSLQVQLRSEKSRVKRRDKTVVNLQKKLAECGDGNKAIKGLQKELADCEIKLSRKNCNNYIDQIAELKATLKKCNEKPPVIKTNDCEKYLNENRKLRDTINCYRRCKYSRECSGC